MYSSIINGQIKVEKFQTSMECLNRFVNGIEEYYQIDTELRKLPVIVRLMVYINLSKENKNVITKYIKTGNKTTITYKTGNCYFFAYLAYHL